MSAYTAPSNTAWYLNTTSAASTTVSNVYVGGGGSGGFGTGLAGLGQQQLYGSYQQAQQQAQYAQMQQMAQSYPPVPPLTLEDHARAIEAKGHVVLTRMHRAVHTKLIHAHGGLARIPVDAPMKLTIREIDGYALPATKGDYVMPDGSVLLIDEYGNYRIEDHDAKVTYRANRTREFNPYINASDLLEAFVREVGNHPLVTQMNVLRLPIEAFINYLITEAAKRDGDSMEGLPKVEDALLALPAPVAAAA